MDNRDGVVGFTAEELAYLRQWRRIKRPSAKIVASEAERLGLTATELRRRLSSYAAAAMEHIETGRIRVFLAESDKK